MFNFAHSYALYLLLLIPLFYGLFFLARLSRKKKLEKYGKLQVIRHLMPAVSPYKPYIKIGLELVAVAALVIAIARPRAGATEDKEESTRGIEVMIAFDVSRSMLASSNDDPAGISRLDRAKHILDKLVGNLDNDKVGLVVFAGDAYTQLPLTTDFVSARMYLNSLSTNMIKTQGTSLGYAISLCMNSFTPDEETGKAIVLITDAEDHEGNAVETAREAANRGIQVDIIGVGSTKGNPIPLDRKGNYLKDNEGNVVTSALNAESAAEIASAGNGVYINGSSSSAISEITDELDKLEKGDLQRIVYKPSAEQFPLFGWIALVFLFVDSFISISQNKWLGKFNFFTGSNLRSIGKVSNTEINEKK